MTDDDARKPTLPTAVRDMQRRTLNRVLPSQNDRWTPPQAPAENEPLLRPPSNFALPEAVEEQLEFMEDPAAAPAAPPDHPQLLTSVSTGMAVLILRQATAGYFLWRAAFAVGRAQGLGVVLLCLVLWFLLAAVTVVLAMATQQGTMASIARSVLIRSRRIDLHRGRSRQTALLRWAAALGELDFLPALLEAVLWFTAAVGTAAAPGAEGAATLTLSDPSRWCNRVGAGVAVAAVAGPCAFFHRRTADALPTLVLQCLLLAAAFAVELSPLGVPAHWDSAGRWTDAEPTDLDTRPTLLWVSPFLIAAITACLRDIPTLVAALDIAPVGRALSDEPAQQRGVYLVRPGLDGLHGDAPEEAIAVRHVLPVRLVWFLLGGAVVLLLFAVLTALCPQLALVPYCFLRSPHSASRLLAAPLLVTLLYPALAHARRAVCAWRNRHHGASGYRVSEVTAAKVAAVCVAVVAVPSTAGMAVRPELTLYAAACAVALCNVVWLVALPAVLAFAVIPALAGNAAPRTWAGLWSPLFKVEVLEIAYPETLLPEHFDSAVRGTAWASMVGPELRSSSVLYDHIAIATRWFLMRFRGTRWHLALRVLCLALVGLAACLFVAASYGVWLLLHYVATLPHHNRS